MLEDSQADECQEQFLRNRSFGKYIPDFVVLWKDARNWNVWNRAGMGTPIDELPGLGIRSRNLLRHLNIGTVAELLTYSEAELLRSPNFGRKSLLEIAAAVAQVLGPVVSPQKYEEDDFVRWCLRNRDRLEPLRSLHPGEPPRASMPDAFGQVIGA